MRAGQASRLAAAEAETEKKCSKKKFRLDTRSNKVNVKFRALMSGTNDVIKIQLLVKPGESGTTRMT